MDTRAASGLQVSPMKDFDQIVEIRAEKREHLRGRNNVTSCRSPTREFDTKQIKNELKEKRHLEFLRRRSVSPEPCCVKTKSLPKTFSTVHHSSSSTLTANGHPAMISPPNSSSRWVNYKTIKCCFDCPTESYHTPSPSLSFPQDLLWSDQVTETRQEKGQTSQQASMTKELNLHTMQGKEKRGNSINGKSLFNGVTF